MKEWLFKAAPFISGGGALLIWGVALYYLTKWNSPKGCGRRWFDFDLNMYRSSCLTPYGRENRRKCLIAVACAFAWMFLTLIIFDLIETYA